MQTDLHEGYYLDNVLTLFDHIESVYADILDTEQLGFLKRFRDLPDHSKKLYIRLLNRQPDCFRLSKLGYPEIESNAEAARQLEASDFILVDSEVDLADIIGLFTKSELLYFSAADSRLKKLRRGELDEVLLQQADELFFQQLFSSDCFLKVLHKDSYQIMQMLFFGNLNQSMTDFVLRDLGLYRYENYKIDARNRPYRSSQEIEQHWFLHQLDQIINQLIEVSNTSTLQALLDCFHAIPEPDDSASPVYRKAERIKIKIARQIERIGDVESALSLYPLCKLSSARERIARIQLQQKAPEQALLTCQQMINSPIDESELQFAEEFSARLVKRHKLDAATGHPVNKPYQPDIVELELYYQSSVELAVAEFYSHSLTDQQCFYLENSLFNGVLGLLIWDAIFAPEVGAFFNPFQYRPSDFHESDFVAKRQQILNSIWSSVKTNDDIYVHVKRCWESKYGLANPLVNWQNLNLNLIELALQRIGFRHWLKIFERILLDLRNNRSGFPDLILFPPTGGYNLIEVKGPGDKLQKNQQRWMAYFSEHQIPHSLVRVNWKTEPPRSK